MKKTLVLAWLLAWFMAWISTGVLAAAPASTPFMPTWSQRHQLQRLVDEAGLTLPMTHWPLPAEVVRQALEQLPTPNWEDRKSTRLNSSHSQQSRMPSSA